MNKGREMNTASQPLALLYVRVSTNKQAKSGHSLDSQPALLTEAAEREGYRVEIITETGSGRNTARPALNGALDRLAKGEASALYALDTDRLARSTMHLLEIAQLSLKQNWRLVITTAQVDTSSPAGEAFLTMAAAFAQFESRMISLRVQRQHEQRRQRGEVWGVTMGSTSPLPAKTRELVLSLRSQGLGYRKIAEHLTAEGIPTALGGQWHRSTIQRIINSPQSKALIAA